MFGRRRSRRAVDPDGTIHAKTTMLPRDQWGVVIHDHHPGYITWEQYLRNEQQLAANRTQDGARPAREGRALLQGIVRCGSCGRQMSTRYSDAKPFYDCSYSRIDRVGTPGCRGVIGDVIEQAVAERLLAAVAPDQITLALTAADTVADRATRATRAVELRAERARYDAARAERAFHQCDPDNRLVARSLEARWEAKLRELTDAETELASQTAIPTPPSRADIEALARDLPRLWAAPSTSHRDRKRLLRAMIADITLTFAADQPDIRIGIHWRSGATDELTVLRPGAARDARRAAVLDLLHARADAHQRATRRPPQPQRPRHRHRTTVRRGQRPLAALAAAHPRAVTARRRRTRRPRTRPAPQRRRPRHLRLDPRWQARRPPRRPAAARDPVQRRDRGRLPPAPRRLTQNPLPQPTTRCRRITMKPPSTRSRGARATAT